MAEKTKAEVWAIYAAKNPSFEGDGDITMSAAGLRKFFDQAFDMGEKLGKEKAKNAQPPPKGPSGFDPFGSGGSPFDIFGKRK
jgi:hypothetical protein